MIAAPPPSASNAASASPAMTAGMESSHQATTAFLTARKFAQFLQQQQQQQRQKELNETTPPTTTTMTTPDVSQIVCPKKRQRQEIRQSFGDTEEDDDEEGITKLDVEDVKLLPLELLRARWESRPESPSADSAGGSSTGSSNEIGLGREVKKRRLDELLSKKFSVADSPPNSTSAASSISPPPVVSSSTPQQQQQQHQSSPDISVKKVNRRKPSSPVSSLAFAHPATSTSSILSVRPPSELFAKNDRPIPPRQSPVPRRTNSKSPHRQQQQQQHQQQQQLFLNNIKQEENESELLKGQLMQLQLAQAALLSGAVASSTSSPTGSAFPGLAGLSGSGNPLLYYGYYAQMLQGLQAQQQKLLEQLASQKQRFMASPNATATRHDATKLLMASPSHGSGHLLSANDSHKRNVSLD